MRMLMVRRITMKIMLGIYKRGNSVGSSCFSSVCSAPRSTSDRSVYVVDDSVMARQGFFTNH